jgi:phosphatidate cytidylyltransferase
MKTRIISAFIAVALVILLYFFWGARALYAVGVILSLGCVFEYARLALFPIQAPRHLIVWFMSFSVLQLLITVFAESERLAFFSFAVSGVLFLSLALLTVRRSEDLPHTLKIISSGIVGFLYCGVFPALAIKTLEFDKTGIWLFCLLAIVFAGDSCAYFAGRFFGKTKLLEVVSPQKTVEGAIGGLIGSGAVGALIGSFWVERLTGVSLLSLVLIAMASGVFAQIGDLFESLLKRIAEVKDSGSIMPGHGGVLDRLDGVLFAAPIFYVLARILLF